MPGNAIKPTGDPQPNSRGLSQLQDAFPDFQGNEREVQINAIFLKLVFDQQATFQAFLEAL